MRVAGQEVVAVSRSNQSFENSSMQTAEVYIQVQRLRRPNPVFLQIALQFRLEHINLQNEYSYFLNIPHRDYLWLASVDTASSYQWLVISSQE